MTGRGLLVRGATGRSWRSPGPTPRAYLQGQLSQDVTALAVGTSAWSFLLQPTGKVDALVRVTRTGETAVRARRRRAATAPRCSARLQRFRIRVKAELEPRGAGGASPSGALVRTPVHGRSGRLAWRCRAWWGAESGVSTSSAPDPVAAGRGCRVATRRGSRRPASRPAGRRWAREITEQTDPGRARARARPGRQLHQGLLPRPGAGGAHGLPGSVGPAQVLRRLRAAGRSTLASRCRRPSSTGGRWGR